MTPDGIKPATFRFVAQHLNHCATAVPFIIIIIIIIINYFIYINNFAAVQLVLKTVRSNRPLSFLTLCVLLLSAVEHV